MGVAQIKMPQLGESVTEGTVDRWLKKEGEFVKRDEPIVEVVTDKVNAEIPSPFEGTLVKIEVEEGATVAVGTLIARIDTGGDGASTAEPAAEAPAGGAPVTARIAPGGGGASRGGPGAGARPGPAPPVEAQAEAPAEAAAPPAAAAESPAGGPRFSPAVRRLAEEHGIDPSTIN